MEIAAKCTRMADNCLLIPTDCRWIACGLYVELCWFLVKSCALTPTKSSTVQTPVPALSWSSSMWPALG